MSILKIWEQAIETPHLLQINLRPTVLNPTFTLAHWRRPTPLCSPPQREPAHVITDVWYVRNLCERKNSGQEDNLSKSHVFSWISHKSEHFDFPHFFPSVSSGHDRSWLAPSTYYYTTQLVLTCTPVSGCTLHNIQDRSTNLKPTKTNLIKEAVLFSGVSWTMSEYNPLSFLMATRKSSVCHHQ